MLIPTFSDSLSLMAQLVYINETGWRDIWRENLPTLWVAAIIADETTVPAIDKEFHDLAMKHLGQDRGDFEFQAYDLFHGNGDWSQTPPIKRFEAFEDTVRVIERLELKVAYSSINKKRLNQKYGGRKDHDAYLLGVQFLLEKLDKAEKLDRLDENRQIILAAQTKGDMERVRQMVSTLEKWQLGVLPVFFNELPLTTTGPPALDSSLDSSYASPGVQLAGLVAFALQHESSGLDTDPDAIAAIERIVAVINAPGNLITYRSTWPSRSMPFS